MIYEKWCCVMFWQTFRALCFEADKTPQKAAKEMGFSSSAVKNWKAGAMPHEKSLNRIAEYFHFPIQDLTTEPDGTLILKPMREAFPLSDTEKRVIRAMRNLSPAEQELLAVLTEAAVRHMSAENPDDEM